MSQNSFYGGKQGRTYNIVAHYDSVYQMVTLFQNGGNYNDVNYNEYVIIDTIVNDNQRYNKENGLLYRRGMAYGINFNPNDILLNDNLSIADYDLRKDEVYVYCTEEDLGKWSTDCLVPPDDEGVTVCRARARLPRYRHFECMIVEDTPGTYIVEKIHQTDLYTTEEAEQANREAQIAVQSDPQDGFFNFKDQWSTFVLDPGGGAEYVGQIVGPKGDATQIEVVNWLEFEEALESETSYGDFGETFATRRPGIEEDDEKIAYYDDIQFGYCNIIDSEGNIGKALVSFDMPVTNIKINAVSISPYNPEPHQVETLPEYKPTDIRDIYYLIPEDKYYIWDETKVKDEPESEDYPAEYLKEEGFVEVTPWSVEQRTESDDNPHHWRYTGLLREHQDSLGHPFYKDFEVYIPKGIHGIDFDGFDPLNTLQQFELFYNWTDYDSLDAGEEGTSHKKSLGKLKVVKETSLEDVGRSNLLVDYFNGDRDIIPIPLVQRIDWNYRTGDLTFLIRKGETTVERPIGHFEYIEQVKKDKDRELDETKRFRTYFNVYAEEGSTERKQGPPSDPVNELVTMQLYSDNLVVLYSDPEYRQSIYEAGNYVLLPYEGNEWTVNTGDVPGNPPKYYWENLGPILNGEHVFGKFATLEELKQEYPNGFDGNEAGWVASVVTEDPEHSGQALLVELYAYDYYGIGQEGKYPSPEDAWYQISSVAKNAVDPRAVMIVSERDAGSNPTPKTGGGFLQQHGYWFEVTEIEVAEDEE